MREKGKPLQVAVIGTFNWIGVAAELLRRAGMECQTIPDMSPAKFVKWVLSGGHRRFDVIHHVRGTSLYPGLPFAMLGKPVVWHWIGTDIMHYTRKRAEGGFRAKLTRSIAGMKTSHHVADSPKLVKELTELGIEAKVVRLLPACVEAQVIPLPEKPAVLSYWDKLLRDFYRMPDVLKIAAQFPDVDFYVVGDDGSGVAAPSNVKFMGRLPSLSDIYPKISVYLRLVEHDSLSAMVLEAMARGRYVVYSEEFPFAQRAQTVEQAVTALKQVLSATLPYEQGAEYIRTNFSLQEQAEELRRLYGEWFE